MITETKDDIIADIKIKKKKKKNEIIKAEDGIKIKITAQPIDGKANKCLIEFLSKTFKIPKTSITIVKGETSKTKTILFSITDKEKINLLKKTLYK